LFVLGFAATALGQKIYKTVDNNGHVTFSTEAPPAGVDVEIIQLEKAPSVPVAPAPSPGHKSTTAPTSGGTSPEAKPAGPEIREIRYEDMSLAELDAHCEIARQSRIRPLREVAIDRCIAGRSDPEYCRRYYSDYGESGVNANGVFIPRMFDDLAECMLADDEHGRRSERNSNINP
jgi:hypothetical protein